MDYKKSVTACVLFLPSMVAIGIDCAQWSYGALIACSTAIILHLKGICSGDWRQSILYQVSATKAQLRRLPSRGVSVSCREIKVRAKCGLNQASVRSPLIGRGRMRSQVATSSVCVSQGQYSDF